MIFYLVASCGLWIGKTSIPAALSSFLLLRGTEYFILSFIRKTSFDHTFRGSLLIGLIPLIFPSSAIYLLAIPLGMFVFRRSARETTAALIAGLLPLFTYAYTMWALDYGFIEPLAAIWHEAASIPAGLTLGLEDPIDIMRTVVAGITVILLLLGLFSFMITSNTMRTRSRTIFIYFILLLIIGVFQLLLPGDVVKIAPDVIHWHGAAPDSEFTHIAIGTQLDKGGVTWLEPVTDEEYNSYKENNNQ